MTVLTGKRPAAADARRHNQARWAVTAVALAGVVAGCSSQTALPRGSVASCAQFGVTAIRHHVTVTAVPAACQGLSRVEVNVAVDEALEAAAAGVLGKVRRREVVSRDSRYLVDLIRAVPAPGQPARALPQAGPPSRVALGLAALAAWLVTVGLGLSMMARWIIRRRRHGTRSARGRGSALNFTHFGLAVTGLLIWISYLATGAIGLAWAACGLLVPVAGLGMSLLFSATDSSPPASLAGPAASAAAALPEDHPPSARHPAVFVVAAHITVAVVTILLAVLAAIGP